MSAPMGMQIKVLEKDIEELVESLGFEMVTFERAGGGSRPLLRLRIDRPGVVSSGQGVTVDDCAHVSRALEAYLDTRGDVPARSIVEVSSPGVERPLVKPGDYERFAGQRVLLQGYEPLIGRQKRIEGLLLGLSGDEVAVDVDGERLRVPIAAIAKANLVYDWEADLRG